MGFLQLLPNVQDRIQSPIAIILGSPRTVAEIVKKLAVPDVVCYQLDLHQAARLRDELQAWGVSATVEALPDLWDLPTKFRTVLHPVIKQGERELKIDMIDQSFHILEEQGLLISLSDSRRELLCPKWHKKVFGQCSELPVTREGSIYWSKRTGEQERRRHELSFDVKMRDSAVRTFLSRPGVFSYGRFDEGARALVETAQLNPGDRILDLGCGIGTNGILAAFKAGEGSHVTFVDSNVRAIQLTEMNARANGLTDFRTIASPTLGGMEPGQFDIVLANPPYYAELSIARKFIEGARPLLKPGGRFWVVTKQTDQMLTILEESFEEIGLADRRGYAIFEATT